MSKKILSIEILKDEIMNVCDNSDQVVENLLKIKGSKSSTGYQSVSLPENIIVVPATEILEVKSIIIKVPHFLYLCSCGVLNIRFSDPVYGCTMCSGITSDDGYTQWDEIT